MNAATSTTMSASQAPAAPRRARPVACLLGPTASGKTAAALAFAARRPVEIVSVDSALVYRGMDIGTAKPSASERALAPHHLIDIIDPADTYSAADFRADALRLVGEIDARGNVPLLVGGTMLYFKALTEGLNDLPAANQSEAILETDLRAGIEAEHIARQIAEVAGAERPSKPVRDAERTLEPRYAQCCRQVDNGEVGLVAIRISIGIILGSRCRSRFGLRSSVMRPQHGNQGDSEKQSRPLHQSAPSRCARPVRSSV